MVRAPAAGATVSEPPAPPDGTYVFALARDGTDQGTTTVVLTRRAGQSVIETDEVGVVGAARARIVGAYRYRDLLPESYVATYQAPFLRTQPLGRESWARPHVPFDTQTTVRYHLEGGAARATIDTLDGVLPQAVSPADVPSPVPAGVKLPKQPFVLDGPFMTGYVMLPAYLRLTRETAVAPVSLAFPPARTLEAERPVRTRPRAKIPAGDVAVEFGTLATLWYDPRSLMLHEVYLEDDNLDARLISYVKGGGLPNLESATPSSPPPELPSQPVSFNSEDGTRLSGARTFPSGTPQSRPAGVLLVAPPVPEPATRDYSLAGPDPMLPSLARTLVQRGYAVLRYDERGAGRSAGDFEHMTWEQSLADAEAALRTLVSGGGIDAKHVYVLGYGCGADLALALADRDRDVAGVVALGPSVVSYRETSARLRAARIAEPSPSPFFEGRPIAPNLSAWQRSSFNHDPVALAVRTQVPLFVLHSGVVEPARTPGDVQSYDDRLRSANPRATIIVANDLSDRFGGRYDADSSQNTEALFPYRFDASTADAIADWLDEAKTGAAKGSARSVLPAPPAAPRRPPPPPPANAPALSKPLPNPTVLPGQLFVPGANQIPPPPAPAPSPSSGG